MEYNLVMPTSLDLLHLMLAVDCLILFLVAVVVGSRKNSASNQDLNPETAPVDAAEKPTEPKPTEPKPTKPKSEESAPALLVSQPDSALQVLSLLQQEARFVDFLHEDLSGFSDQEIGAVARVVHEGGKKMLNQYFVLEPVRAEDEESAVTLEPGFNSAENRITGNVVGQPPFKGVLVHKGWRAAKVDLPKLAEGHDTRIIAPAEVEL